jgi:hypothetical protein
MKRILLLSLVCISLFSCSLLESIQQRIAVKNCQWDFVEAAAHSFSLTDMKVDLKISAMNPNQVEVVIDRLDLMLFINERQTVKADFAGTSININQTKTLTTTLTVPYITVGMAIIDILRKNQPVKYRLDGTVYIDTRLGTFSFPITIYENQ